MKGLLTTLYALLFFAVAPNSLATSLTFEVQPGIYLSDATILGLNLNYSGSWIEYSYANIPFTA
ncbi:hypothetical protein [Microbulbifer spongiae]|uniref:Uncharacterized protein n=1 Tax=Microbulbifer spongiae TaxID=2944933 RepID=A0ABY9E9T4_9GAMM|nr:hypothetical protein [Microbulbifer sp. MI-G]WKD49097.1 hypothetical protein M8T91_14520 [Microbulbifer sp. MI-G]